MMNNTPPLRFKKYNKTLVLKKMHEICNIFAGGTPSTSNSQYWNGDINWIPSGLIQDCFIDEKLIESKITEEGLMNSSTKMIKPNSALLAMTGATCGKAGYLTFDACANQSVMAFEPYTFDALYIYYLFQKNKNYILQFQAGGAQAGLNKDTCENLAFYFPEVDEQKQVSNFLYNLENSISSLTKQLEKIELYKRTMMVKMFPSEKNINPEIKFRGFNTKWNKNKFGSIFDKLNKNSFSRDLLNYKNGDVKNIHYGDILIKFGFTVKPSNKIVPYINENVDVSNYDDFDYLKDGDVIFADTAEDTTAGKMVEIQSVGSQKVLSGLHTYPCRPKISFASGFLGILLNTPFVHDQLIPYMQGTKVTSYNFDSLCKIEIAYPESLKEQEKIVNFFNEIDSIIDNTQKEIVYLKHLKSSMLNLMLA